MRPTVRATAAVVLTAGLTFGVAAGSHASVAAKGSVEKFCQQAFDINSAVPDSFDDEGLIDAARDAVKAYKKLAKAAPTAEVRKASKTASKYYARLVKSGDPNSSAANYNDKEVDAVTTLTQYYGENCSSVFPTS